jgi:hypothetical protein
MASSSAGYAKGYQSNFARRIRIPPHRFQVIFLQLNIRHDKNHLPDSRGSSRQTFSGRLTHRIRVHVATSLRDALVESHRACMIGARRGRSTHFICGLRHTCA